MKSLKLSLGALVALLIFAASGLQAQDTTEANKMTKPRLACFVGCENIISPAYRSICSQNGMVQLLNSEMRKLDLESQAVDANLVLYFSLDEEGAVTKVEIPNLPEGDWGQALQQTAQQMPKLFPPERNDKTLATIFALQIEVANGEIVSNLNYDEAKAKESPNITGQMDEMDEMPRFSGCESKKPKKRKSCADIEMLKFIYKNLKYPEAAKKSEIQGTVIIRFIVDEAGNVVMPEVLQGIGGGCDEGTLSIFTKMPQWIPAMKDGKAIPAVFNCPVKYKLR